MFYFVKILNCVLSKGTRKGVFFRDFLLHPPPPRPSARAALKVAGQMNKQHVFTQHHRTVKRNVALMSPTAVFMALVLGLLFIISLVAFIISQPLTSS